MTYRRSSTTGLRAMATLRSSGRRARMPGRAVATAAHRRLAPQRRGQLDPSRVAPVRSPKAAKPKMRRRRA